MIQRYVYVIEERYRIARRWLTSRQLYTSKRKAAAEMRYRTSYGSGPFSLTLIRYESNKVEAGVTATPLKVLKRMKIVRRTTR